MATASDRPGPALRGRAAEREVLDGLLRAVRAHERAVLVVRGEPGVGKTALLDHVERWATGCLVVRVGGVEAEGELAFAGLHQLCAPLLDRLDRLPAPQRDALATAFGLTAGPPPDRFIVGLAALGLLSAAAEERPLVCLVDDAQWLDRASAQVLAFVARRLHAEAVALVVAVREQHLEEELAGLPVLPVRGLGDEDARALLDSATLGRLDAQVRDRVVAEARGNPLALLELPKGLGADALAVGFGRPDAPPLTSRIERSFAQRLQALPPDTQRLLLVAAAEPLGDPTLFWPAVERLGLDPGAIAPAEAAGLIELGTRVRFRHCLVRSAAYRNGAAADRRRVHGALAEVTDAGTDPDRRSWHRAAAALGPDEAVAADLERSARRAGARGGAAAAGAFLQRAAELTPDPERRAARALTAAQCMVEAAVPDAASQLLTAAEMSPLDDLQRAHVARLRAQLVFLRRRGCDAPPLLLEAARRLAALDGVLARDTYLEAFRAAIYAARLGGPTGAWEVAAAAASAPPAPAPPRAVDLLLDALTTRYTQGYVAGVPPLRHALEAFRRTAAGAHAAVVPGLPFAWGYAGDVWDDELWHELAGRTVRLARDAGALAVLAIALEARAIVRVYAGEFAAAAADIEEAAAIAAATGSAALRYSAAVLAAWRGDEAEVGELTRLGTEDGRARGEGRIIGVLAYCAAVLHNGLGQYDQALLAARRAAEHDDLTFHGLALAELVEAGVRGGARDEAAAALARLEERAGASATDWARGVRARARALLAGDDAEAHHREAIARLGPGRLRVELARAHLLYGEWLRREDRRVDARRQLRLAHDLFSGFGAAGFAERARHELAATGETVRARTPGTTRALTPQEAQIARLAAKGHTNPEIAARLFLSPRTVEYHLAKVFPKLGIGSRRQLAAALGTQARP